MSALQRLSCSSATDITSIVAIYAHRVMTCLLPCRIIVFSVMCWVTVLRDSDSVQMTFFLWELLKSELTYLLTYPRTTTISLNSYELINSTELNRTVDLSSVESSCLTWCSRCLLLRRRNWTIVIGFIDDFVVMRQSLLYWFKLMNSSFYLSLSLVLCCSCTICCSSCKLFVGLPWWSANQVLATNFRVRVCEYVRACVRVCVLVISTADIICLFACLVFNGTS